MGMFRGHRRKARILFSATDIVLLAIAFQLAYWTRTRLELRHNFYLQINIAALLQGWAMVVWVGLGYWCGFDHRIDAALPRIILRDAFRQCLLGSALLVLFQYLLRLDLSRSFVFLFAVLHLGTVVSGPHERSRRWIGRCADVWEPPISWWWPASGEPARERRPGALKQSPGFGMKPHGISWTHAASPIVLGRTAFRAGTPSIPSKTPGAAARPDHRRDHLRRRQPAASRIWKTSFCSATKKACAPALRSISSRM